MLQERQLLETEDAEVTDNVYALNINVDVQSYTFHGGIHKDENGNPREVSTAASGEINIKYDHTKFGANGGFFSIHAIYDASVEQPVIHRKRNGEIVETFEGRINKENMNMTECFCRQYATMSFIRGGNQSPEFTQCMRYTDQICNIWTWMLKSNSDIPAKGEFSITFNEPLKYLQQVVVDPGRILGLNQNVRFEGYSDNQPMDYPGSVYKFSQMYGFRNITDNFFPLISEMTNFATMNVEYSVFWHFESSPYQFTTVTRAIARSMKVELRRKPQGGLETDLFILEVKSDDELAKNNTYNFVLYKDEGTDFWDLYFGDAGFGFGNLTVLLVGLLLMIPVYLVIVQCRRRRLRERQRNFRNLFGGHELFEGDNRWLALGVFARQGNQQAGERSSGKEGATRQQIQKIKEVIFDSALVGPDDQTTCPISLEQFEDGDLLRELPCTHLFQKEFIDKWLLSDKNCPVCRHPIDKRLEVLEPADGRESFDSVNEV